MPTHNTMSWRINHDGTFLAGSDAETRSTTPPFASGTIDPAQRTGTITHFQGLPATLSVVPHEVFDVLDARFPQTRWWIMDPVSPGVSVAARPA
jgi:hypothetical protein